MWNIFTAKDSEKMRRVLATRAELSMLAHQKIRHIKSRTRTNTFCLKVVKVIVEQTTRKYVFSHRRRSQIQHISLTVIIEAPLPLSIAI